MFLGMCDQKRCDISSDSPNNSVCVTGLSGTGKTSRLNKMELANVMEGATVLVIDVSQTHTGDKIFPYIRAEYMKRVNRIDAINDGLGLELFQAMQTSYGEVEPFVHLVNSAVQAISSSQGMGSRQIGALRNAVISSIKNIGNYKSEAEALALSLLSQEDSYADSVYQKLWTVLNCGALRSSSKNMKIGDINIIDFSGADMIAQTVLSELVLANLWRSVQFRGRQWGEHNLVIVLDEFQNLSLKKEGVLRSMLREGRKFGVDIVLATQTLDVFQRDILAVLNQTATRLYFRPAQNEVQKNAKEIEHDKAVEWAKQLQVLNVGECIARGELCIDGMNIKRPLLLK